ncbi:MAG: NifU family protein [Acidimicrobiales bacterium]|nr:NifU family protein [Acidimicrobiales bacterium]
MTTESDVQSSVLQPVDEPVVTITPEALVKIIDVRDNEDDPESLVLRIAVTGVNGIEYAYDLAFEPRAELAGEHLSYSVGGLEVVVPVESVDALTGATLDIPSNPAQGGLVIRNPNRPDPLAGRNLELTGELPDKVQQLLDQSINPGLAAHGGYAELVGVEGNTVFVTMGGGCQGCSMSAATLSMGIQRAIKEAIPEVEEVVDVTDHASGANPYYA